MLRLLLLASLCLLSAAFITLLWLTPAASMHGDAYSRWKGGGIYDNTSLGWLPESQEIVLSSPALGRGSLLAIKVTERTGRWLTRNSTSEIHPKSTPDGSIIFCRIIEGRYGIIRINPSGAEEIVLTLANDHAFSPVAVSHDEIAFRRTYRNASPRMDDIWMLDQTTGSLERLPLGSNQAVSLHDSKNGKLYVGSLKREVVCFDTATQKTSILGKGTQPAISTDGTTMYTIRKRTGSYQWDVVSRKIETGVEQTHNHDGTYISAICCLPNGSVAVINDVVRDRVGRLMLLDPVNNAWTDLGRILELSPSSQSDKSP